MKLRDYQAQIIVETRSALRQFSRVLIQAPTGAGKTALTVHMMKRAAERGLSSFFIVHQKELLSQTSQALWMQKLEHGMIVSGKAKSKLPVQVASVQTLVNRLESYDSPALIIIDEAHRATSASYRKVIEAYPDAMVVGLTATPQRTDGKPLGDLFSHIICGPTIRSLIDMGFLSDYKLFAPQVGIDVSNVSTTGGDYNKGELEAAADVPTIIGDAVTHYKKLCNGKKCVVMCVSIKHAKHVADSYNSSGIPAVCIEGTMSEAERKKAINKFKSGEVKVITNVQLLIEGVDIPSIEVVQWLRPTQSLIVYMQGNGRGLRPFNGKNHLIILDHVNNCMRHGLPDQHREWSLDGQAPTKRKKSGDDEDADVNVSTCNQCYAVFMSGVDTCPQCGAPVEKKVRKIEQADGDLKEVDIEAIKREQRREQGSARSMRDLVRLGLRKGMRNPSGWAANVLAAREKRRPTGQDFETAKRIEREERA